MQQRALAVIFPTYEDVETVQATLPSVLQECKRVDAALIVHDASTTRAGEMRAVLSTICTDEHAFLVFTSPMAMGAARNMCLDLAMTLFSPTYVCMLEDDHGLRVGSLTALVEAMQAYYGHLSPNGLTFGMFSGCLHCWRELHKFVPLEGTSHIVPDPDNPVFALGGANSCFRCAPASHWTSVLKGYDTDEYMISNWQTRGINYRNYYRGFTTLYVDQGDLAFTVDRVGQGYTQAPSLRRWDELYTASDRRSEYAGKNELGIER